MNEFDTMFPIIYTASDANNDLFELEINIVLFTHLFICIKIEK